MRPISRVAQANLTIPERILVYDFEADGAKVTEYLGILRQQPSSNDPVRRRNEMVRDSSRVIMIEIVNGLRALGLRAERATRASKIRPSDLIVRSFLLELDQGNPFRRLAIGFGSGASKIKIRVKLIHGATRQPLLEFIAQADSGKLPGAVATVPAGAAIHGGMTAGMLVGSGVGTGMEAYRSDLTQMAKASAEQAIRYLSEYFAKQGWIKRGRVVKARITY